MLAFLQSSTNFVSTDFPYKVRHRLFFLFHTKSTEFLKCNNNYEKYTTPLRRYFITINCYLHDRFCFFFLFFVFSHRLHVCSQRQVDIFFNEKNKKQIKNQYCLKVRQRQGNINFHWLTSIT